MPHSARAFLREMQLAAEYLLKQAASHSLNSYQQDETLRFAVERNFITLGEAMSQLRRDFSFRQRSHPGPRQGGSVSQSHHSLVLERDDREVWSILITQVAPLKAVIDQLLADPSIS